MTAKFAETSLHKVESELESWSDADARSAVTRAPRTASSGEEPPAEIALSIVIPAHNEAPGLSELLPALRQTLLESELGFAHHEIIVVDDGSTDDTGAVAKRFGASVITHPFSMGNGAAIKSGARAARGNLIVFMDGDGQHDPKDIARLLKPFEQGYEMVVGARSTSTHASVGRRIANLIYNRVASLMSGYQIDDLTSGFRIARARHFKQFLYLLPNGFSYPTTSTMAFLRSGLPVGYVPIDARKRIGKSKIRVFKDGTRFLIIILKIGTLFSPMRLFLPTSAVLFSLASLHYLRTYLLEGRFTNMSALLYISSLLVMLIGLLSEQVSSLHYRGVEENRRRVQRSDAPVNATRKRVNPE